MECLGVELETNAACLLTVKLVLDVMLDEGEFAGVILFEAQRYSTTMVSTIIQFEKLSTDA